jgi:hypothetical protein
MKTRVLALVAAAVAVTGVVSVGQATAREAQQPTGCSTIWAKVNSAPGTGTQAYLNAVAAVATDDVWAVGAADGEALIEHWNGVNWSVIPNSPGLGPARLQSIDALAANDVWAVGSQAIPGRENEATLTMHWDGSSWSVVDSPSVDSGPNELLGVDAVAADDVWAVGHRTPMPIRPIAMHWDGTSWTAQRSGLSSFDEVFDVWSAGGTDTWASGSFPASDISVKRWDGTTWNDSGAINNTQLGIDGISPSDIWAVGSSNRKAEHWDGSVWHGKRIHDVPGSRDITLYDLVAVATNNVWAAGWWAPVGTNGDSRTLIEHWDGTRWRLASSQNGGGPSNFLHGVSVAGDEGWAVGHSYREGSRRVLILHACGL